MTKAAKAGRVHFVRCPVIVHEFLNDTLGVTFQGNLIAEYTTEGTLIRVEKPKTQRKRGEAA